MLAYLASRSNQTVNAVITAGKIVNLCLEMGTLNSKTNCSDITKNFLSVSASERSIGICFIVV